VSGFWPARLGVVRDVLARHVSSGSLPGAVGLLARGGSGLGPLGFDAMGWGFGVSVVTRQTGVAKSVGSYGWDGGLGTSWFNDPASDLTVILMTQRAWTSSAPGPVFRDFWTTASAAVAD
jgi:CubicO group peptidase (beta-lactamase class C family)